MSSNKFSKKLETMNSEIKYFQLSNQLKEVLLNKPKSQNIQYFI